MKNQKQINETTRKMNIDLLSLPINTKEVDITQGRTSVTNFCKNDSMTVGEVTNRHLWTHSLYHAAVEEDYDTMYAIIDTISRPVVNEILDEYRADVAILYPASVDKPFKNATMHKKSIRKNGKIDVMTISPEEINLIYRSMDLLYISRHKETQKVSGIKRGVLENLLDKEVFLSEVKKLAQMLQAVGRFYQERTIDMVKNFLLCVLISRINELSQIKYASKKFPVKFRVNLDGKRTICVIRPSEGLHYIKRTRMPVIDDYVNRCSRVASENIVDFATMFAGDNKMLPLPVQEKIIKMVESSPEYQKLVGKISRFAEDYLTLGGLRRKQLDRYSEYGDKMGITLSKESREEFERSVKDQYAASFQSLTDSLRYELRDLDPIKRIELCIYAALGGYVRTDDNYKMLSGFVHQMLREEFLIYMSQLDVEGYERNPFVVTKNPINEKGEAFVDENGATMYRHQIADVVEIPSVEERSLTFSLWGIPKAYECFVDDFIKYLFVEDASKVKTLQLVSFDSKADKEIISVGDWRVDFGKLRCGCGQLLQQFLDEHKGSRIASNMLDGVNEIFYQLSPDSNKRLFITGKVVNANKVPYWSKKTNSEMISINFILKDLSYEPLRHTPNSMTRASVESWMRKNRSMVLDYYRNNVTGAISLPTGVANILGISSNSGQGRKTSP